jgi:phosphate transport system substrate-binding protein
MMFACAGALAACNTPTEPVHGTGGAQQAQQPQRADAEIQLQGAGATFPFPLYSRWVSEYEKRDPRVRIDYQSIGSGGGIKQVTERTVDFGASDAPMTDEELGRAPAKLVHIPTTLGAVAVAYNVPGVESGLHFSPQALAGIFLGEVKTWNHPLITKENPGAKLPAQSIAPVYRTDGSGTTAIFTQYLSAVSDTWKGTVGAGKSVKFPVGLGAKGNEGVAGQVKSIPGSVGYVELAYVKQTGLAYGWVKNHAGKPVEPTLEAISAAGASVASAFPEDMRLQIVDPPGEGAYPLAAFTYILVYEDQPDPVKGRALAEFLWWGSRDGQKLGPPLFYAPLPAEVVTRVEAKLRGLRAGATPLLPQAQTSR